jgi:hypothetical protein
VISGLRVPEGAAAWQHFQSRAMRFPNPFRHRAQSRFNVVIVMIECGKLLFFSRNPASPSAADFGQYCRNFGFRSWILVPATSQQICTGSWISAAINAEGNVVW